MLSADTRVGFCEFSRRAGDFALGMAVVTYRLEGRQDRRGARRHRRRRGASAPDRRSRSRAQRRSAREPEVFHAAGRGRRRGDRAA